MEELKLIELTIDDIEFDNVVAISLVEFPAMEEDFLKFNKDKMNITLSQVDKEKRIITGPAMIPNKHIYRYNYFTGEEYNVYFSTDTVKKISENYLIEKKNSNVTLDHESNVNGVSIVESWIVDNPELDKSANLGYKVNEGTWMVSMKINNDKIWNEYVKQDKVKGFSIEGFFTSKFEASSDDRMNNLASNDELSDDIMLDIIAEMLELDDLLHEFAEGEERYFVKVWDTEPGKTSTITGEVPEVCDFCRALNGVKVPYGYLFRNPQFPKYTKNKPGSVHPLPGGGNACRCEWHREEVTKAEWTKAKKNGTKVI